MRTRVSFLVLVVLAVVIVAFPLSSVAIADKGGDPHEGSQGKGHQTTSEAGAQEGSNGASQTCDGDPTGNSDTGHGANQGGPYDHNCTTDSEGNPSPSGNGNGNGNATGRPCAGCVGRADDKNPGYGNGHGQMPDGSDHNNGYECDGNHGIGRTNPAHTGCGVTTSTPPPPPPPGGPQVAIEVLGIKVVAGAPPTVSAGGQLARTGFTAVPDLMLMAASLIAAGLVLSRKAPVSLRATAKR